MLAPFFTEYSVFVGNAGAKLIVVPPKKPGFGINFEGLEKAITANTRALIIDSPNNPVGAVYTRETLLSLASVLSGRSEELGHPIYLVSDEPYREITYGADVPWVPAIYDRTIVCYSYSKSLSLPGERIGWALVPNTNPDHDELVLAIAGAGRKLGFVCAPALFQRVLIDCVDEPTNVEAYARNREALAGGLHLLALFIQHCENAVLELVHPAGKTKFHLWFLQTL